MTSYLDSCFVQGYDPHTFSKELETIEDLCKSLEKIEETLQQATSNQFNNKSQHLDQALW